MSRRARQSFGDGGGGPPLISPTMNRSLPTTPTGSGGRSPNYGVEIQVYCGIIACLLIMLCTGRKPTKRTFEMVCFFPSGLQTGSLLTAEPQINNLRL